MYTVLSAILNTTLSVKWGEVKVFTRILILLSGLILGQADANDTMWDVPASSSMMVTLATSLIPRITLPATLPGTIGLKFTCDVRKWCERGGNIEGEVGGRKCVDNGMCKERCKVKMCEREYV